MTEAQQTAFRVTVATILVDNHVTDQKKIEEEVERAAQLYDTILGDENSRDPFNIIINKVKEVAREL